MLGKAKKAILARETEAEDGEEKRDEGAKCAHLRRAATLGESRPKKMPPPPPPLPHTIPGEHTENHHERRNTPIPFVIELECADCMRTMIHEWGHTILEPMFG